MVDNILLIEDSPEKSVYNEEGSAIFPQSWHQQQRWDNFLVRELLPWLHRLNSECQPGRFRDYVQVNRIGNDPLAALSEYMQCVIQGMKDFARNLGFRFELPGQNLRIEPGGETRALDSP